MIKYEKSLRYLIISETSGQFIAFYTLGANGETWQLLLSSTSCPALSSSVIQEPVAKKYIVIIILIAALISCSEAVGDMWDSSLRHPFTNIKY